MRGTRRCDPIYRPAPGRLLLIALLPLAGATLRTAEHEEQVASVAGMFGAPGGNDGDDPNRDEFKKLAKGFFFNRGTAKKGTCPDCRKCNDDDCSDEECDKCTCEDFDIMDFECSNAAKFQPGAPGVFNHDQRRLRAPHQENFGAAFATQIGHQAIHGHGGIPMCKNRTEVYGKAGQQVMGRKGGCGIFPNNPVAQALYDFERNPGRNARTRAQELYPDNEQHRQTYVETFQGLRNRDVYQCNNGTYFRKQNGPEC